MASSLTNVVMIKIEIDESETENGKDFEQEIKPINSVTIFAEQLLWMQIFPIVVDSRRQTSPFYAKRVRHNNIVAPWQPCIKLESGEKKCTIRYVSDGREKEIGAFEIACNKVS